MFFIRPLQRQPLIAEDVLADFHRYVNKVSSFAHTLIFAYTNCLECHFGTGLDYELGHRGVNCGTVTEAQELPVDGNGPIA